MGTWGRTCWCPTSVLNASSNRILSGYWKLLEDCQYHTLSSSLFQTFQKFYFHFIWKTDRKRETKASYPLVQCPDVHNSPGWSPEPEQQSVSSIFVAGSHGLSHHLHLRMCIRRVLEEKAEPGLKPSSIMGCKHPRWYLKLLSWCPPLLQTVKKKLYLLESRDEERICNSLARSPVIWLLGLL